MKCRENSLPKEKISVVLDNTVKVRKAKNPREARYIIFFLLLFFKINKQFLNENGIRFVAELPSPTKKMDFINHLKIDPVNAPTNNSVQKVIFKPNFK